MQLLSTLDEIFYNISDSAAAGDLKYTIGTSVAEATSLREFKRRFKTIRCPKTEIQESDDLSTVCYTCGPGSYRVNESCLLCPIGTYQSNEGSNDCRLCPPGTSTKYVGAKILADCVGPCLPGHFSNSGLEPCDPCAKGKFQDNPGSTFCKKCPDDMNTFSVGSMNITECVEFVNCKNHGVKCDGGICFRKEVCVAVQCFCPEEVSSCQGVSSPSSTAVSCSNNGVFVHLGKENYGCRCPPEFSGKFCESRLSACDSLPCQNGGSCVDHISYFKCQCPMGYTGDRCDSEILDSNSVDIIPLCSKTGNGGKCYYQREGYSNPDFDIVFNTLLRESDAPIRWVLSKSLGSLMAVMWLRSDESNSIQSTLLSFNIEKDLTLKIDAIFKEGSNVKMSTERTSSLTAVIVLLPQSVWHRVTIEWFGLTGFWRLSVNDSFVDEVHVPSGNYFVMTGSVLELAEAFNGEMSQFALHDQPMFRGQPTNSSGAYFVGQCRGLKGNLIEWTDVLRLLPYNSASASLRNGSWCMDVNECLYSTVHKCQLYEQCVDLQGSWTCRPCDQLSNDAKCHRDFSVPITSLCDNVHCQHNGSCNHNGTCMCQPGYTGTLCESLIPSTKFCNPNPCLNGGLCLQENDSIICRCQENWTGKYCQVSYAPSCELNPCVNNGSCVVVVQPNWKHYRCICPELGRPLGANCEFLAICDTMPCMNGGKCVNLDNQRSYYCMCPASYTGQNCETYVYLSPVVEQLIEKPFHDFCHSVDCHNGGSCVNMKNGFLCKCPRDYKGQYCEEQRLTETKKFQVTLSLLLEYDSRLNYDTAFQEYFRLQIHRVFANFTTDQKMYVVINNIRKGNSNKETVLFDFTLIITFYLDSIVIGSRAVQTVLIEHLLQGKLGSLPASFDDFHFESVLSRTDSVDVVSSDTIALYVMVMFLIIVTTIILFYLLCRYKNTFSRIYNEIVPFYQILNSLQQRIVKSNKLQSHQEKEKNIKLSDSKFTDDEENRFVSVSR